MLIGAWKLESWVTEIVETKERFRLFGSAPNGFIHFTAEGRTFAILTAENRKPVTSETEQIKAFGSLVAYTGRYRIEGNQLITTVDISADPGQVGVELVRYFKCDGEKLEITTAPFLGDKPSQALSDKLLQSFLIWRRDKP